jgi:predicted dehydrogenase
VQAFCSQIDNFSRTILGKEPLLVTTEDALASVDAIEAAYASLQQNNWVPVIHMAHGTGVGSGQVAPVGGGNP